MEVDKRRGNTNSRIKKQTAKLSKTNVDILRAIFSLMGNGESFNNSCRIMGSDKRVVWREIINNDKYFKEYNEAKLKMWQYRGDNLNDYCEDDPERDKVTGLISQSWIQWQKLKIETDRFMLSKVLPKIYGEKIQHDVKSKSEIVQSTVNIPTDNITSEDAIRIYQDIIKGS